MMDAQRFGLIDSKVRELSATHHQTFQLIHLGAIVIKDTFIHSESERENDTALMAHGF